MGLIDFVKKHEKLLQGSRDNYRKKFVSLKERIEELQSIQPDYQKIADRLYGRLQDKKLLLEVDEELKVGDQVIGIGEYDDVNVDGLMGRIVKKKKYIYGVEWEKKILPDGHNCDGKAKQGYGWFVKEKNLKKRPAKPKITTKNDYDEFLSTLKIRSISEYEDYVDYEDKDFKEGDKVMLLADLNFSFSGEPRLKKGTQARIGVCSSNECDLIFDNGKKYYTFHNNIAKVKQRKKLRGFKEGNEVELREDVERKIGIKGWGYVRNVSAFEVIVDFQERYVFRDGVEEEDNFPQAMRVSKKYLKHREKIYNLKEIIRQVEAGFNLREYDSKRLALADEISELIEKEIISSDEINDLVGELSLFQDLHDEELEELLE